jgi:CBS domain-containing protein
MLSGAADIPGGEAMTTAAQILEGKGHAVWSVAPDSFVYEALKMMAEKNVGALVVLEGDELKGIFSERDYARKVILAGKSSREITVKEIMSPAVITVRPQQSVEECMALMTDKRIRHLPVVEGGRLVGVISIGDAVKAIISEREFTIEQLQSYIRGSG